MRREASRVSVPGSRFDWFVPAGARANARESARIRAAARALLAISAVVSGLLVAFLLARREPTAFEWMLFAAAIGTPLLGAVGLRGARDVDGLLIVVNLAGIACVAAWAFATGGVRSAATPWLVALLATLVTFGNRRLLAAAVTADLAAIAGLYLAEVAGMLPENLVPPAERPSLALLGHASAVLIVGFAALLALGARVRAEARLRQQSRLMQTILDTIPGPVAHVGADGRYTYVNRAFISAFGAGRDGVVGRHAREVLGEAHFRSTLPYSDRVARGEPVAYERTEDLPDGSRRLYSVRYLPEIDEQGRVRGLVSLTLDVTERARIEAELVAAKEQAEAASRAKTIFLASMSHEVRTPMNGVIGMAEVLLREPLAGPQRDYALTILRSARALLGLLDDVLDVSKIEAGRFELRTARFDLPELLQEVAGLYAETARAKGIAFTLSVADDLPRWVTGDAVRLRQVLVNLVSNAVKFTDRGSVSIAAEPAGAALRFTVRDTGIGIPYGQQERIFDAFVQADQGTARRYGGTGLGLSIAREIVRLMGGRIALESAPGEGAAFSFEVALPLAEAPAQPAPDIAAAFPGRRVLVADDDRVNAEVTRILLEYHGVEVVTAADGDAVLREHERRDFDLVLMDCEMPGMDGFEATRRIREREAAGRRKVPIVAVTAHAIEGYRERCLQGGMDDYLAKPFEGAALAALLGRWLGAGG